ncbi:hypothetical protein [Maridesulfovibrio sp.]|uniref:hypothetical protein n=1 Tax=Maridesulfovibrio sp. TaxID=2795000 RepID=UPI0029F5219F|nr:hypothetical protein [Maridesulfovibrio sp.]
MSQNLRQRRVALRLQPMHCLWHVFASTLDSSWQVDITPCKKMLTHKTPALVQRYAHLRNNTL